MIDMKLIAQVRLYPTDEQKTSLLQTLEAANAVCNRISDYAWDNRVFRQYDLHHAQYHQIREDTGLAAQMVVRCTAKVADAYKLDKKVKRRFKPRGSIAYDDRILSWEYDNQVVSIWTVDGRQRMNYGAGERQQHYLQSRQGETDLVYFNGMFFLLAVCDIPDPDEKDTEGALGVDLGVVNIATTSDGDIHTSETIEKNRQKQQRLRSELQQVETRSAKRKLKKLSGRQARFQKDVNHCISKRIVTEAERTNRAIALEDLKGIRERTRAYGKEQRAKHSNWSFAQLRDFLTYKAKMAGIPIVLVDPAYTSQRCFECGHTERANRKTQDQFLCVQCGHSAHADVNAAKNIALRAAVNPPIVTSDLGENSASVTSPRVYPGGR